MPRHAKRTQRRTKRRTRRARKTRRNRRTRRIYGGMTNTELQNSSDPNQFATYYISKYGKEKGAIKAIDVKPDSILVVVDMQNDFVDRVVTEGEDKLNGPGGIGAFAVTGGKNCIDAINNWVDANASNLSKIILTRDWHPPNHCSFGPTAYPPHCIYNTLGADIVQEIKAKVRPTTEGGEKFQWNTASKKIDVDVVFKGFHTDSDSYGAAQYNDPEYLKTRQIGTCCKNCMTKTGGSALKSGYVTKSLDKIVFEPSDASPDKYTDAASAKTLTENLSNKYFNQYFWRQIVPDNTNIYVVGLAGDFCVKDTAINLKKSLGADKGVNVHVIQDLTRYAFVPGGAIPFSSLDNVKATDPNKSLSDYIFKSEDGSYRTVPVGELDNLTIEDTKSFTNWHFVSDQKTLIKDYKDNEVNLVYLPGGDVSKVIDKLAATETPTSA